MYCYSAGAQALSFATFGRGTGPIYLDNLICTSNETRLVDCAHNGIANHNCLHSEDAGLRCPCMYRTWLLMITETILAIVTVQ